MNFLKYLTVFKLCILLIGCSAIGIEKYFSPSGPDLLGTREGYLPELPTPISGPNDHVNIVDTNFNINISVVNNSNKFISFGPLYFAIIPTPWEWFKRNEIDNKELYIYFTAKTNKQMITWDLDQLHIKVADIGYPIYCDSIYYKYKYIPCSNMIFNDSLNCFSAIFVCDTKNIKSFSLFLGMIECANKKIDLPEIEFKKTNGWVYSRAP